MYENYGLKLECLHQRDLPLKLQKCSEAQISPFADVHLFAVRKPVGDESRHVVRYAALCAFKVKLLGAGCQLEVLLP